MDNFEKNFTYMRLDKEPTEMWSKGLIYQNGEVDNAFKVFQMGYSFGRVAHIN